MKYLTTTTGICGKTSPPSRGAWIEIMFAYFFQRRVLSPPSRGAWIEMLKAQDTAQARDVAPLAGGVD